MALFFVLFCSYLILREPRQCQHGHRFCANCIFTWTMTAQEGSRTCPVCRSPGRYGPVPHLERELGTKKVKCEHWDKANCPWQGTLRTLRRHWRERHKRDDEDAARQLQIQASAGNVFLPSANPDVNSMPPRNDNNRAYRTLPSSRSSYLDTEIAERRHRIDNLMEAFSEQLRQRRDSIETVRREQERERRERLDEIHTLSNRLSDVAGNLMQLLDSVSHDPQRFITDGDAPPSPLPPGLSQSVTSSPRHQHSARTRPVGDTAPLFFTDSPLASPRISQRLLARRNTINRNGTLPRVTTLRRDSNSNNSPTNFERSQSCEDIRLLQ
jgi:hypothetical protein